MANEWYNVSPDREAFFAISRGSDLPLTLGYAQLRKFSVTPEGKIIIMGGNTLVECALTDPDSREHHFNASQAAASFSQSSVIDSVDEFVRVAGDEALLNPDDPARKTEEFYANWFPDVYTKSASTAAMASEIPASTAESLASFVAAFGARRVTHLHASAVLTVRIYDVNPTVIRTLLRQQNH